MNEITFKKTEIISRQILLYFFDFYRTVIPIFDKANFYRIPFKEYDKFRLKDKIKFSRDLYRLKRAGFIKLYFKNEEKYLELTKEGKNQLKSYFVSELEILKPVKWDKKWRIVIFDIPVDKNKTRHVLQNKLNSLGFVKLQESVYVFPFECLNEINLIREVYFIKPYVQYLVVERIETETNLLKIFYDRNILNHNIM